MKPEITKTIKSLFGIGQMYGPLEGYKTRALALLFDQLEATIKNLEKSINHNAETSSRLANRIFWLNLIIAGATVVGAAIAMWNFFFPRAI